MTRFFVTCPRGLERVLEQELAALGAAEVTAVDGGARCAGEFDLAYAINLESRVASRVLWQVGHSSYRTDKDIFEAVRALPWTEWFDVDLSIRVDVSAIRASVKSLDFVTLRVKDAVCDAFRARTGRRPDVDTRTPDVRIHAFLSAHEQTLYLDSSGEALFKRGYRTMTGEAPLRENLAAGILRLSGWTPETTLLDPMCGSGTFLTEAALIALDRAPGLERSFGFEKLKTFDAARWKALKAHALARVRKPGDLPIYGSDRYGEALKLARANLAALGLERHVTLKQADVLEMPAPAASGVIVTNPPYGVRLHDQQALAELYPKLGDALKKKYAGWTAYILTADLRLPKLIGLAPSRRTPLYNGALECRLFEFRLVAGSMRKPRAGSAPLPPK
ncbi:MAG TPA: class I SAM-dependent RNA methyltransferase [Burkholderiales bacterium]|nr:class I SAM-dependent RNA methyltransferase [Burkholderiales bacterium]